MRRSFRMDDTTLMIGATDAKMAFTIVEDALVRESSSSPPKYPKQYETCGEEVESRNPSCKVV